MAFLSPGGWVLRACGLFCCLRLCGQSCWPAADLAAGLAPVLATQLCRRPARPELRPPTHIKSAEPPDGRRIAWLRAPAEPDFRAQEPPRLKRAALEHQFSTELRAQPTSACPPAGPARRPARSAGRGPWGSAARPGPLDLPARSAQLTCSAPPRAVPLTRSARQLRCTPPGLAPPLRSARPLHQARSAAPGSAHSAHSSAAQLRPLRQALLPHSLRCSALLRPAHLLAPLHCAAPPVALRSAPPSSRTRSAAQLRALRCALLPTRSAPLRDAGLRSRSAPRPPTPPTCENRPLVTQQTYPTTPKGGRPSPA